MRLKTFGMIALLGLMIITVLSFAQAAPPLEVPGNILDRITELENRIDVLESHVADLEDQVAELQEQGDPGPALYFGEKVGKLGYTVYQAETDGLVFVYGWGQNPIWGKTDPDPSKVTGPLPYLLFGETLWGANGERIWQWRNFMMPVRAGDYWYVEDGDWGIDCYLVSWIPLIASE